MTWKTYPVTFSGGLKDDSDPLYLAAQMPGAARELTNYEPSIRGGYTRIQGFAKFDSNTVTGSGAITGVFVFGGDVIAQRAGDFYKSGGSGWTKFNSDTRSNTTFARGVTYNWGGEQRIMLCDGVNQPAFYNGTTYTVSAVGDYSAIKHISEYKNHFVFAKGNIVYISDPNSEFGVSNATTFNMGDEVTGLKVFRDSLIVFGKQSIQRITGKNSTDFSLSTVTANLGCLEPDTIQEVAGDLVFLAPDGLRPFSATEKNEDFELASISRDIQPLIDNVRDNFSSLCSVVIRSKNQYRLLGYSNGVTSAAHEGVIGVTTPDIAWQWSKIKGFKANCADSGYDSSGNEVVIFANDDGYVYRAEQGSNLNGSNIEAIFATPYFIYDDAELRKTIYKSRLFVDTTGSFSLTLGASFDWGEATLTPADVTVAESQSGVALYNNSGTKYGTTGNSGSNLVYGADPDPVKEAELTGSGFSHSLRFVTSDTNPAFTMKGMTLQYSVQGRN